MESYRIWTDRTSNRLHMVLHQPMSDLEIEDAQTKILLASGSLKQGFTVNISYDLPEQEPASPQMSQTSRRYLVNQILKAISSKMVA